jgi:zinc transport system substrate-binding protein
MSTGPVMFGHMKMGGVIGLLLTFAFSVSATNPAGRLQVLTSFLPLYCFTLQVAGASADVENLLPANVSPHEYQFARGDLRKLEKADLVIVNGCGVESWLDRLLQNGGGKKTVVAATAGMEQELIYGTTPLGGGPASRHSSQPNPHVWLDPVLAQQMVTNILLALQHADPAHAAEYATNAAAFASQLQNLNKDFQKTLGSLQGAPMVTLHDAFPYLARRYNLRLVGVLEEVPDVDPSAKYLQAFQRIIRKERIGALFVEKEPSSRLAVQLAGDLKLKLAELDTMETGPLRKDAYELSMRRNLKTLSENLFTPSHEPKRPTE